LTNDFSALENMNTTPFSNHGNGGTFKFSPIEHFDYKIAKNASELVQKAIVGEFHLS
jgi:hypothetical protein